MSAEINANLTIQFQQETVYEDGRNATLSIRTLSNSGAGLHWSGGLSPTLEYWRQGEVELRVDYDGSASPSFSFYGGGNPAPVIQSLGRRDETLEQVIQFQRVQVMPFSETGVQTTPEILFSTTFIDEDGGTVIAPRFRDRDGSKELFTTAPAWGSVCVTGTVTT